MTKGEMTPDQLMSTLLADPELDESEIYKAIKNDTNGVDEGDLNHLEAEEGEDVAEGGDDEMENEEEDEDGGFDDYAEDGEDN